MLKAVLLSYKVESYSLKKTRAAAVVSLAAMLIMIAFAQTGLLQK